MAASSSMSGTARTWALALTRIPSVTGSRDEASFAGTFLQLLAARPALATAKAEITAHPIAGDPIGRSVVAVLVRGEGARTVILTGHYDTVGIEDYGDLKPVALEPEALHSALIARLRGQAKTDAERRALTDLDGGGFLPGRGLLDMKAGLAAGLAVVEDFARRPGRCGNLLFLAVPDEEACIHLLADRAAWAKYREQFTAISALLVKGGFLIVSDCARQNFFDRLGMQNPLCPTIEWHKHQQPGVWARLLAEVGFQDPKIHWEPVYRLGKAGEILTGNLEQLQRELLFLDIWENTHRKVKAFLPPGCPQWHNDDDLPMTSLHCFADGRVEVKMKVVGFDAADGLSLSQAEIHPRARLKTVGSV